MVQITNGLIYATVGDELSYVSDIPKSQIVRIEKGEVNTGISSVAAIAKALKVEPKKLFEF